VCTWFLSPQPLPGRVLTSGGGGVTTGGGGVVTGGVVGGGDSSGCDVGADGVVSTGGLAGVTTGGAGAGVTGVVGVGGVVGVVGVVVGGAGVFFTGGKPGFGVGGDGTAGVRFSGRRSAANCGRTTALSRTACCFATTVRGRVTTRTRTRGGGDKTGAATELESGGGAGSETTIVGRCRMPRIRVSAITPTAQAARKARNISLEVSSRRQTAQVRSPGESYPFGWASRSGAGRGRASPRLRAPKRSAEQRPDRPTTSRTPS